MLDAPSYSMGHIVTGVVRTKAEPWQPLTSWAQPLALNKLIK